MGIGQDHLATLLSDRKQLAAILQISCRPTMGKPDEDKSDASLLKEGTDLSSN
jgi:hypothetical protein